MPVSAHAQLTENFESFAALSVSGWVFQNNSNPLGSTSWFQGNDGVFPAYNGPNNSYVAANFNNSSGTGDISNWMLTPLQTLANGSVFSFFTRGNQADFADRLELRMSTSGLSTFVGASTTSVGDFTTLLTTINSTLVPNGYPGDWTQVTATVSGLGASTTGRFAFRYFVPDVSVNGDYIGIDAVRYSSSTSVVPEPSSMVLVGAGILALAVMRRRRRA
ncbi:MAG: choice-of-anchor J domain-containing protein [Gemmatimonadaceae bacterium]